MQLNWSCQVLRDISRYRKSQCRAGVGTAVSRLLDLGWVSQFFFNFLWLTLILQLVCKFTQFNWARHNKQIGYSWIPPLKQCFHAQHFFAVVFVYVVQCSLSTTLTFKWSGKWPKWVYNRVLYVIQWRPNTNWVLSVYIDSLSSDVKLNVASWCVSEWMSPNR